MAPGSVVGDPEGGEDYDTPAPEVREIHQFLYPRVPVNYLDISGFKSILLPTANKPLEPSCMYKMKEALLQVVT